MHFYEDPKLEQLEGQLLTVCQNGGASLLFIDKNV